jgi:hypothetical protein
MLHYLKDAFWFRVPFAGLGRVPANALATLAFAILGFGHPSFWLLGLGLEAGYLAVLASHPRFQRWVEAEKRAAGALAAADSSRLSPPARARLQRLEEKRARVLELYEQAGVDDFVLSSNRDALERLTAIYRQLLAARSELEASRSRMGEQDLRHRIAALETELAQPSQAAASPALRESQAATLKLLQQRRDNLGRATEALREIDSDLERIEAQVDLTLESAGLPGRNDLAAANIELASQLLSEGIDFSDRLALEDGYLPERIRAVETEVSPPPPPPRQREKG